MKDVTAVKRVHEPVGDRGCTDQPTHFSRSVNGGAPRLQAGGLMRALRSVTALSVMIPLGISVAPIAHASDWALNGRFLATSNGDWARTNDIYRNEQSVRTTWTVAMRCSNVVTCSGKVTSDAGWSADIVTSNGEYTVKRELPNWEPCADGSGRTVTGHQRYRFFPVDDGGFLLPGSRVFAGFDTTSGESGGCSLNKELQIEMPFRLEKLD
jgi:hypothetical protein